MNWSNLWTGYDDCLNTCLIAFGWATEDSSTSFTYQACQQGCSSAEGVIGNIEQEEKEKQLQMIFAVGIGILYLT